MAAAQGNQSSSSPEKQALHVFCQPGFTQTIFREVGHFHHQPHNNTVIKTDIYAVVRMDYDSGPKRINSVITSTKGRGYVRAGICLFAYLQNNWKKLWTDSIFYEICYKYIK